MSDAWVERFKKEALPRIVREIRPAKVFLFGSRVTGEAREESDLDVIIVSERFEGVRFLKRMEMLLNIARFPKHVDYLCYTPEEFERMKSSSSLIRSAMRQWVEIAA
ncbi:MAG: nucleotidyltransferase domain-containing protein [Thermoplasmata archaeon]